MALPCPLGTSSISLANIRTEFSGADFALNSYYKGGPYVSSIATGTIPATGQISFADFYCSENTKYWMTAYDVGGVGNYGGLNVPGEVWCSVTKSYNYDGDSLVVLTKGYVHYQFYVPINTGSYTIAESNNYHRSYAPLYEVPNPLYAPDGYNAVMTYGGFYYQPDTLDLYGIICGNGSDQISGSAEQQYIFGKFRTTYPLYNGPQPPGYRGDPGLYPYGALTLNYNPYGLLERRSVYVSNAYSNLSQIYTNLETTEAHAMVIDGSKDPWRLSHNTSLSGTVTLLLQSFNGFGGSAYYSDPMLSELSKTVIGSPNPNIPIYSGFSRGGMAKSSGGVSAAAIGGNPGPGRLGYIINVSGLYSNLGQIIWQRTLVIGYGDMPAMTAIGNYSNNSCWVGGHWSDGVTRKAFVAKYNGSNGIIEWQKFLTSSEGDIVIKDIVNDALVPANTYAVGTLYYTSNRYNILVVKLDSNGNIIWARKLGGSGSTAQDAAGSIVIQKFNPNGYDGRRAPPQGVLCISGTTTSWSGTFRMNAFVAKLPVDGLGTGTYANGISYSTVNLTSTSANMIESAGNLVTFPDQKTKFVANGVISSVSSKGPELNFRYTFNALPDKPYYSLNTRPVGTFNKQSTTNFS
jgi:hypothetical protein